jgi:hypothetical protein
MRICNLDGAAFGLTPEWLARERECERILGQAGRTEDCLLVCRQRSGQGTLKNIEVAQWNVCEGLFGGAEKIGGQDIRGCQSSAEY